MPIGMIFWMLMIISFVFWGWTSWGGGGPAWGGSLLMFVLLFLLGWHDFGFVVH